MDNEGEGSPNRSPETIEEELGKWPESVYHDVAEAEALGRAARQRVQRAKKRNRTVIIGLLAFLILCGGVVVLLLRLGGDKDGEMISTNTTASPEAQIKNLEVKAEPLVIGPNFKKTEATISNNGQDILRVVEYDFHSAKFIVNNTALKNQNAIVETFKEVRDELNGGWVIIFASASFEGPEDHNLDLCKRRLFAVKSLLSNHAGLSVKGYWGVLAGEYKMDLSNVPREKWEDEEDRIAEKRGEKWLQNHRKLIVITIRQIGPLSDQSKEQVPEVVGRSIYEKGLLPGDYDAPGSPVFLLRSKPTKPESNVK